MTPTSSVWLQLCVPIPRWVHPNMEVSLPTQRTLSNQMGPVPTPKAASFTALPPANCSCLQTTWAAESSQKSSHIVPHWLGPFTNTSTLPDNLSGPPTRRTPVGSKIRNIINILRIMYKVLLIKTLVNCVWVPPRSYENKHRNDKLTSYWII